MKPVINNVAVLSKITTLLEELKLALPNVNFTQVPLADTSILQDQEIVIADFDLISPFIYDLPKLKWLQGTWAGVDKLLTNVDPNKPKPPFLVTRFSGKHFGRIMSEYVLSQIIWRERAFDDVRKNQILGIWDQDKFNNFKVISDLSVGIMGLGEIGSWVVRTLSFLGATVFGFGRKTAPEKDIESYIKGYFTGSNLGQFLSNCDYVVNILPNTSETRGLLNGTILKCCEKRKAAFINVGRGSVISDDDLVYALNQNWISAAILDVFNVEPLPKTNPLWTMPQVKITPHVSAPSRAKDIAEQFKENYEKYVNGETPRAVLNFTNGY